MPIRSLALTAGLLAASIAAAPSVDHATIADERIEQVAQAVGGSDAERSNIKRRLSAWKALLESPKNSALGEPEKLRLVNDFMHETPFYCDPVLWCHEDFWATPVEFLANDGGDCEDFSIAKYFTLRALGIADEKLRIVYAVYRRGAFTGAHMVLAFYPSPEAEPLILDNLNPAVLPGSSRSDLTPIFSFNSGGLWAAREQKGRGNTADPYPAWREHWRRVQTATTVRSVTPDERRMPVCQALIARSPWCR